MRRDEGIDRLDGTADAVETPIGFVPTADSIDVDGIDISADDLESLLSVDSDAWKDELELIEDHYEFIGERLPATMREELDDLRTRLSE